ncbi:MAG: hypothetical protein V8T45_00040 [Oscillospiraceae bacterium]
MPKQYDSTGELNTQTDFSYNEDGSFTVWPYFYDYDGSVSREMSVYDKNGNRTHYAAYPAGGYLSHGSDSRYDENGNIIEHSEFGVYGVTYGTPMSTTIRAGNCAATPRASMSAAAGMKTATTKRATALNVSITTRRAMSPTGWKAPPRRSPSV